jgi:tRNA (guanine26-N2/guanine27-N2)-dimethyltransferase
MGGPIWSAPIHDQDFVQSLLKLTQSEPYCNMTTHKRIFGMLTVVSEELPDVPLYYAIDKLCCVLKLEMIPMLKFRSAILQTNHRVSSSHACKSSIKTDAKMSVLWDILRCWAKLHPVKASKMTPERPLTKILEKESSIEINFDEMHPQANPSSRKQCLSRFQQNPAAHWGPGTRSTLM